MNKGDWASVSPVEGSARLLPTTGSHSPYSWQAFLPRLRLQVPGHVGLTPPTTSHLLPWDLFTAVVASRQAWVLGSQPQ